MEWEIVITPVKHGQGYQIDSAADEKSGPTCDTLTEVINETLLNFFTRQRA